VTLAPPLDDALTHVPPRHELHPGDEVVAARSADLMATFQALSQVGDRVDVPPTGRLERQVDPPVVAAPADTRVGYPLVLAPLATPAGQPVGP
jgi:hypothetical protein